MKHIITLLCTIYCFSNSSAQLLLPWNEAGKVSFAEVVKADSLTKEQLYINARQWLIGKDYKITPSAKDSTEGKLTASNGFNVYARGYVSKKIHGKITYTTVIEVKDGKYRYTFNNLVFHYYKEDRNYKMVPSGKTKTLEEENASGWQSLWENHQKQTYTRISNSIAELKPAMLIKLHSKKEHTVTAKKDTLVKW